MKSKFAKIARIALVSVLSLSFVLAAAACSGGDGEKQNDTLVVAYNNFTQKFSPFFATSSYDQDVAGMTQVGLLAGDRTGNIVYKGIEGETIPYNGKNYTYYGLSNLTVTTNEDGSAYYDITMRSDVKFSDGKPVTVKDAIFSMYAFSDNDYDGSSTFYSLPIKGMAEWRANLSSEILAKWDAKADAILATYDKEAGFTYAESEAYTEEEYNSLLAAYNKEENWLTLANDIIAYVYNNYASYASQGYAPEGFDLSIEGNKVAYGMRMWGFGGFLADGSFKTALGETFDLATSFPTAQTYADTIKGCYGGDGYTAISTETAGGINVDDLTASWKAQQGAAEMNGASVTSISGITFDEEKNTIRIETTEYSATTVYQLALTVAPMHYYGSEALWKPEEGSYGFTRNDLSSLREKTTKPMGAGAYKFVSYKDGIVTFTANTNYWQGAPKIKYIKFKSYDDKDKLPALLSGDADIAEPSISSTVMSAIKAANGNGKADMTGDKIATDLIDFNGYGYIGLNSDRVLMGNNKSSEESKNLRKGFATLFAAYREYTVNSYYQERASVIQYPISNVSWAAPQPADEGYETAFAKDVDGNDIYTANMTDEQKWAAAAEAAKGYFKAAGLEYNEETGKFENVQKYEVIIGGDGTGDHPTYALLLKAQEALGAMGIELDITDDSDNLFDRMEAGNVDMFVAAWGGSSDPDMYQVYSSESNTGSNHYHIDDKTLNGLIMDARKNPDKNFRKNVYKQCLDIILDWAVEIPVYQRKNCVIYASERVNLATLTPDRTPFWSYLAEIESLELN